MKLTEAILKRLINEVLEEGMKTASDLPEDVFVKVYNRGWSIVVVFTDKDGNKIKKIDPQTFERNPIYGTVKFEESYDEEPCDKSAVIELASVADGWGPLLYDIAMEVATMRSNGLTPDRLVVSSDAYGVWDHYLNKRSDVQSHQLDDEENTLTPDREDNCVQYAARDSSAYQEWSKSPLSKRYTKEPTTIKALGKKLIWEL